MRSILQHTSTHQRSLSVRIDAKPFRVCASFPATDNAMMSEKPIHDIKLQQKTTGRRPGSLCKNHFQCMEGASVYYPYWGVSTSIIRLFLWLFNWMPKC